MEHKAALSASAVQYHDILSDLENNNLYFDELVDMIPAKLYVKGQSGDDYNPKYFKGQAKESKEARRAKNKQSKRAKFNPALSETTSQTKQRLENTTVIGIHRKMMPRKALMNDKERILKTAELKMEKSSSTPPGNDKKSRIEVLREKLHAKLVEKRGQRPSDPNSISKRAARRAEKKKRREEAIKRNKRKTTSNAEKSNNSNTQFKMSTDEVSGIGADPAADLARVDFGRLVGLNPVRNSNYTEINKALKNLSKTKNLEKMLADAESKKERLEELKKSDKQEDKEKAANIEWGNAIKEATGERVKDDPAKIKKALKHKAAKKQKSAKGWKARMETTKQKMDERQKIRSHNLSRRKQGGSAGANLSSKRIELEGGDKKTTRNNKSKNERRFGRAGFEGRKQDFLNKKESK